MSAWVLSAVPISSWEQTPPREGHSLCWQREAKAPKHCDAAVAEPGRPCHCHPIPKRPRPGAVDAPQQPAAGSELGWPSLLGGRIINTPNLSPRPPQPEGPPAQGCGEESRGAGAGQGWERRRRAAGRGRRNRGRGRAGRGGRDGGEAAAAAGKGNEERGSRRRKAEGGTAERRPGREAAGGSAGRGGGGGGAVPESAPAADGRGPAGAWAGTPLSRPRSRALGGPSRPGADPGRLRGCGDRPGQVRRQRPPSRLCPAPWTPHLGPLPAAPAAPEARRCARGEARPPRAQIGASYLRFSPGSVPARPRPSRPAGRALGGAAA
ncbi:translation initiation factor IF-2-like [Moschus berezovskii]|uniref:translation initiation factor IF-2-like n=1 Tax=Moschus berezovskii TaxID=68408 RepID=UPI0024440EF3|nr:translation initiation factor IF-2-like [Moschus berezovskii]